MDLSKTFDGQTFGIIGNFPYNISSQIVFKALEYRQHLPFFCGMFQKKSPKGSAKNPEPKPMAYSLFCVKPITTPNTISMFPPLCFLPHKSRFGGSLTQRKEDMIIDFDEKLLFKIVKTGFQQRRKTLRNSQKSLNIPKLILEDSIFDLRPKNCLRPNS